MKDNFNRYRILSWHFFSYSTLNMSSYYLLASIVSAKNLAINLIEVSFYVMIHFFLLFSGFFLSFNCLMCLSVDYLHLSFLELTELLGCVASCLLSNFGCFLPLFLQIFFLSLSLLSFCDSHYVCVHVLDGVPQVPWALFIFFFLFSSSQTR